MQGAVSCDDDWVPLPRIEPMLAHTKTARDGVQWSIEPKLDGWRALVYVDETVTVRTRTGRDVTAQVPEVAPLAEVLGRRCILDGELVAGAGLPEDFYALGGRMARRGDHLAGAVPITFVAFDVLWLDTAATTTLPYRERRALLEELDLTGDGWATVCAFDGYSTDLMSACAELGLEGLVAKRADAPYRPGKRSEDWVKIKTSSWKIQHARRRHEHA